MIKTTFEAAGIPVVGQPNNIKATMTNTSDKVIKFLKWGTPVDDQACKCYRVLDPKSYECRYVGIMCKRGKAEDSDYITLNPGESYTRINELKYEIGVPGLYNITTNYFLSCYIDNESIPQLVAMHEETFALLVIGNPFGEKTMENKAITVGDYVYGGIILGAITKSSVMIVTEVNPEAKKASAMVLTNEDGCLSVGTMIHDLAIGVFVGFSPDLPVNEAPTGGYFLQTTEGSKEYIPVNKWFYENVLSNVSNDIEVTAGDTHNLDKDLTICTFEATFGSINPFEETLVDTLLELGDSFSHTQIKDFYKVCEVSCDIRNSRIDLLTGE